jgi:hypothetical protein
MASAITPEVALPLIADRIRRLSHDQLGFRPSYHERALMGIVTDLVDVVVQLQARLESTR